MARRLHPLVVEATDIRLDLNLSQTATAAHTGTPRRTIQTWEDGVHVPTITAFTDYLDGLGKKLVIVPKEATS